nr:EOG090X01BU [Lepidurus arcticus]
MSMELFTANWSPLGNNYYWKFELYSMGWSDLIEFKDLIVASGQYGGPLAVVRDEKKFTKVQTAGKPSLFIFSSSGQLIATIKWEAGSIVNMGWSNTEDLLCIQDDGMVIVYNILGKYQRSFSMGQEAKDTKVLEAQVFNSASGTGIGVLTSAFRVFLVNNYKDPRIRRLADTPGPPSRPSAWLVHSLDRESRVLYAKDKDLYLLEPTEQRAVPQLPEFSGPFLAIVSMAVSMDGRHLAIMTDSGRVWLGSSDLRRKYTDMDTQCLSSPLQMAWCGTSAVVISFEAILLVVGRDKDSFHYLLESTVHLCPESDGVRLVDQYSHEFLGPVPTVTQDIFHIGSMAPAAMLLEASKDFQRKSHRADEYVRMIKGQLEVAVAHCISAAGTVYQPDKQKMLMRAAQFGKSFIANYDPVPFVSMCQILRLLNAVRHYKIGLPLTYKQLETLSCPVLLDRLVLRKHYSLAIHLCAHLKLPDREGASRILVHWAMSKVRDKHVEPGLSSSIFHKLEGREGVSLAVVAAAAAEVGHKSLAIELLEGETRASQQVPLLLQLGEDRPALQKALEAGDMDLVHTVLLAWKDRMPMGQFQMWVRQFPVALDLYIRQCLEVGQLSALRDIYIQEDDFTAQGTLAVREAYGNPRMENRAASLVAAQDMFRRAKNEWAVGVCEDQQKLLSLQAKLEPRLGIPLQDMSLQDTLRLLLVKGERKEAEEVARKFKVPERRWWWIKVLTLSELGDWVELDKLAKSKKSPIGYEPFVDACLEHSNRSEAVKYLVRVSEELKVKYYVKAGLFEQAAKLALDHRDDEALLYVQSKCASDRGMVDQINEMKALLAQKK